MKAAKEKGRVGGRKPGLTDETKTKAWAAHRLYENGEMSISEILKQLNVSSATLYRYLEWAKNNLEKMPKWKKGI